MPRTLNSAVTMLAACLLLGLALGGVTLSQPAPPQQPTVGRYQVFATDRSGAPARVIVCDTTTGQCWECGIDSQPWSDLGTPLAAAK